MAGAKVRLDRKAVAKRRALADTPATTAGVGLGRAGRRRRSTVAAPVGRGFRSRAVDAPERFNSETVEKIKVNERNEDDGSNVTTCHPRGTLGTN
jgi:hypothetical protein